MRVNDSPDSAFIFLEDSEVTFAGMSRLASGGCAVIQRHRLLEPGDHVGILMPNGLPFVATLFALMRMGAVTVPLNTRLSSAELKWQLENADCRLLICEPRTRALADAISEDPLELRRRSFLEAPSQYEEYGGMNLDDDFAIVHTSGTTGLPKAAILTYGNIYQSAVSSALKLGVMQRELWLCVLPLYHVGGLSIILRSWHYGTAVQLMPAAPFDAQAVNRELSEKPITLVSLVPTMLQRLLDAKMRDWNPRLRLILLGGEAPSLELLERCIAEKLPIATSYGLTEAASQVATALPDLVCRKPGTVGKPLMTTQVWVADERGENAPPNEPGEVLAKGATVTRGYYNASGATRAALRDGWLHTGDIGYLDEDGDLFVLQRRADLIISGGENIYPAEVERVLRQHPAVAEAVVFGQPDQQWGQRAAAVVELQAGAATSAEALEIFMRGKLAGYKIPRQYAFVDAMPRTSSGKIQRGAARKVFNDAIARRE